MATETLFFRAGTDLCISNQNQIPVITTREKVKMDEDSILFSGSQASQLISEAALDTVDDPMDNFNGIAPYVKKAKAAKEKLKNSVRQLTLSVDTQRENLQDAKKGLSEVDQLVGKIQGRLTMAKGFAEKEHPSTTEKAYIAAIPGELQTANLHKLFYNLNYGDNRENYIHRLDSNYVTF